MVSDYRHTDDGDSDSDNASFDKSCKTSLAKELDSFTAKYYKSYNKDKIRNDHHVNHDLWLNRVSPMFAAFANDESKLLMATQHPQHQPHQHRRKDVHGSEESRQLSDVDHLPRSDASVSSVSFSDVNRDHDHDDSSRAELESHDSSYVVDVMPCVKRPSEITAPNEISRHSGMSSLTHASTESAVPSHSPPQTTRAIRTYFKVWNFCTLLAMILNVMNVKWKALLQTEFWSMIFFCCFFLLVQGLLQWSVIEIPLMSFATLLVQPAPDKMGDGNDLTVMINYNLLASNQEEVDATLKNAYEAYIGNLAPTAVAVMVSATSLQELKEYELQVRDRYRERIRALVMYEGTQWARGRIVDQGRAARCFEKYRNRLGGSQSESGKFGSSSESESSLQNDTIEFIETLLPLLAKMYANNFMVIQRVTRSLRKCGQYQDLMLLSEGSNRAWSYTNDELYKELARKRGECVFHPSDDVDNVQGREFDYTLVLDGDTGVPKNSLSKLLNVAAANRDRAILQPSIRIVARPDQSLFMHIDALRQELNEPVAAALTTLLGRSGFYGKGLLQNKLYIRAMLGDEDHPIEKVPIDVLSHDTFEAAALSPLYVNSVQLLEEPCGNYVTWDIRECRWNRGELILAHYFFPKTVGRCFTWLMHCVRPTPPPQLILRTDTVLDEAGAYIAHAALRQMVLKPTLLFYIVGLGFIKSHLRNDWILLWSVMFAVIVLPKVPIVRRHNLHKIVAETICSILQFTPEPIMGTYRTCKACKAHITGKSGWIPQFQVERDFAITCVLVASFKYQYKVFLYTVAALVPIVMFKPQDFLLQLLFIATVLLPIYTTLTALPYRALWYSTFMLCCFLALITIFCVVVVQQ